jgi:hypothetical protein
VFVVVPTLISFGNMFCSDQAYLCICDMLIIFSRTMAQNSSELEPLVFDAKKELQQKLMRFLNEKVFIEDDDGLSYRNTLYVLSIFDTVDLNGFTAIYATWWNWGKRLPQPTNLNLLCVLEVW